MERSFTFVVEVTVNRTSGKIASNEDIASEIIQALESADIGSFNPGDGEYETTQWEVQQEEKKPKPRRRRAAGVVTALLALALATMTHAADGRPFGGTHSASGISARGQWSGPIGTGYRFLPAYSRSAICSAGDGSEIKEPYRQLVWDGALIGLPGFFCVGPRPKEEETQQ